MNSDELDETEAATTVDVLVAVRSLYSEHAAAIHGYLGRRVGRDLADDLLADTFRAALEDWSSYDPTIGSARNWLFGISTNLLRRHWRSEHRRRAALERVSSQHPEADGPLLDPTGGVVERLVATDDVARLLTAVSELTSDDYDLLVLSAWESMSSTDVAEVLGIAPGTVRSRLHRIRRQLDTARRSTASHSTHSDTTSKAGST